MKNILITTLLFLSVTNCFADEPDESETMIDTVLTCRNLSFRVQQIDFEAFDSLYHTYFTAPSELVRDMAQIKKLLGNEFQLKYDSIRYEDYTDYTLKEFRKGNQYRLLICETDGLIGFYPRERILMYYGGHTSDNAFFVDSGEEAYNPEYSAFALNGQYSIIGMHSGQDEVFYRIRKYDTVQNQWIDLCWLYDIFSDSKLEGHYLHYIFKQFWVDNTLYFQIGSDYDAAYITPKYVTVAMPE
jgi:hypothetical protein